MTSLMRATFLNNLTEAKLLAMGAGCRDGDIVIPIGADARLYAEQQGWSVRLIGEFFTTESHAEGRRHAEEIIINLAKAIDKFYEKQRGFPRIPLGDYFLFDLYVIVGQVLFTKQLIDSVSRDYSIRVFEDQSLAGATILGIRPHPDTLVSGLVRAIVTRDVEIINYDSGKDGDRLPLIRKVRQIVPASVVDVLYKLRWWKERTRSPSLWRGRKKKLLVLGGMFDWKPIVFSREFMTRYVPTFRSLGSYPSGKDSSQTVSDLSAQISGVVFPTNTREFDFSKLAGHIHASAEMLRRTYGAYCRLAKKNDGVLTSVFVTPFQHVMAQCAIEAAVPVICFQHGEKNLYPETFCGGFTELTNTTHYFAYGAGVLSAYQAHVGRGYLKEVCVVGSTRKKIFYRGGNLVVYATGKCFKTARPYLHDPDPDARLYEAQREIITFLEDYAKRNPHDRVIVKANNTDFFNYIPFKTTIEIDYTSRFTSLLSDARIVILDTPATTCIEAASTSVPLFVLSGRSPWYEEPMEMLKKRAVVEDRADQLVMRLEGFEKEGKYSADLNSRELADAYGGSYDATTASNNVLANLVRIVDGH